MELGDAGRWVANVQMEPFSGRSRSSQGKWQVDIWEDGEKKQRKAS